MTDRARLLLDPGHLLSLGFGTGLIRFAPGTWGTVTAIPFVWLCADWSLLTKLALSMAGFLIGIWLCQRTSARLGQHDPGAIVWDEIVGFFITMALVPVSLVTIIIGFILFRALDILKPWPIKLLDQRVEGGLGIMLDDVVAGLFAGLILLLIVRWFGLG